MTGNLAIIPEAKYNSANASANHYFKYITAIVLPMKNAYFYLCFALLILPAQNVQANTDNTRVIPLNHIVAVVEDDVILRTELDSYLRGVIAQLRKKNTAAPKISTLEKQGLERLVVRSLQLQRARKTGIQVDDGQLNKSIRGIARKNGMQLEDFRRALLNDNIDYETFREDIRDEIILSKLQKRDVINRISVSDQEVEDYLARSKSLGSKNKLIRFSHILIGLPDAANTKQIQSAREKGDKIIGMLNNGADFAQTAVAFSDGQKALEGGAYAFRPLSQVPPLFSKALGALQTGEVSTLFRSPYGFHILKLDESKGEAKHMVAQTRLRHILIRTSTLVSSAEAHRRIAQLKERIDQGEDFAVLARYHSDDTLSAKEGGSMDWLGPGETVPNFEQAFTKLPIGKVSAPFKTRYGWHITEVLERRQQDDTAQFRKTKAINNIKKQKAEEELQTWLRRLRDEAYVELKLGPR